MAREHALDYTPEARVVNSLSYLPEPFTYIC